MKAIAMRRMMVTTPDNHSTANRPAAASSSSALRVVAAVVLVAALQWGRVVLIPLVLSVLITYALEPVVSRLSSWHIPRGLAVPAVLFVLFGTCVVGAYQLRGEATRFVGQLPATVRLVAVSIQRAGTGGPGAVQNVRQAAREIEAAAGAASQSGRRDGVRSVRIEEPTFRWSDWLWRGSAGAAQLVGQSVAVCCLVYSFLIAGDLYRRKAVRMVRTLTDRKITLGILDEINRQIERFLVARVAISGLVGTALWVAFRSLGIREAGVWGVVAAVLYAIPILGPTAVVVGSTTAAFLQFGTLGLTAAVLGVTTGIGLIEGNVLTPLLMSRTGDMNAGVVFVSLMFWGWLWGAWGLLLAWPITATVKVVCEGIPEWRPIAELLKK